MRTKLSASSAFLKTGTTDSATLFTGTLTNTGAVVMRAVFKRCLMIRSTSLARNPVWKRKNWTYFPTTEERGSTIWPELKVMAPPAEALPKKTHKSKRKIRFPFKS